MQVDLADQRAAKQILIRNLKREGARVSVDIIHRAMGGRIGGRPILALFFEPGVVLSMDPIVTDPSVVDLLNGKGIPVYSLTPDDVAAIEREGFASWAHGVGQPRRYTDYHGGPNRHPTGYGVEAFEHGVVLVVHARQAAGECGRVDEE